MCRHRPVGDRFDLFQIGSDAMLTHDATKKWYVAGSKNTLLEVGVQLMLAQKYKNLMDVESVHFHIRLSVHSPVMNEHIIQVAGRNLSYRFVTHLLNVAGALLSPCGIANHPRFIHLEFSMEYREFNFRA